MGRATGVMMVAVVAGLIASQWKHEALPLAALAAVLVLALVKSRWVILDFMDLRDVSPRLSGALVGWVAFFAFAAVTRAAMAAFGF